MRKLIIMDRAIIIVIVFLLGLYLIPEEGSAVKCCLDNTCQDMDKIFTTGNSKECCLGKGVAYVESDEAEGRRTTCIVVGWINGTVFRGEERAAPYTLQVGYIKGGSVISRGRMKLRLKQITHSADIGADYNTTSPRTISISPSKPQSISMWLIRDGIGFEGEESFQLQLSRRSGVDVFLQNNITVVIIDKDAIFLSFEQAAYTYYEPQGINTIPIWITGALIPPNKKLHFSLLITPLTDPSNGVDAINIQNDITIINMDNATNDRILEFSLFHFERVKLFQFSIIEDFIAERTEAFHLKLESEEINLSTMESQTYTTVYIMDNDVVEIGFERKQYTVWEDNSIEVCVEVKEGSTTLEKYVLIEAVHQDISVTSNIDYYTSEGELMTFGQDVSLQCLSIIATGDNERERNKTLVLVLTSTDRSINLQPVAATVTIIPTKTVCMDLPAFSNGFVTYEIEELPRPLGTVATYECDPGFVLIGEDTRTCVEDMKMGVFNGVEPVCDPIVCSLLPEIEDGGISYSPAPGDDDTTVGVGNVATYSCNRGYRLVGLEMRTCVGAGIIGQFSLIEPFCEQITCPDLPDITNGVITYNTPTPRPVDTTATFICNYGFVLMGDSVRNCLENETFSGQEPYCSMILCPDLPPLVNGIMTYSESDTLRPIGAVAFHTCNTGYALVGKHFRTCEDNNGLEQFSGVAPTCEPVCSELPAFPNGMISYAPDTIADFDLGTVATYSCNKSYRLIADSEGDIRTCVDGGEGNGGVFDGTESFCESVCDNLADLPDGVISYSIPENVLGTVATYSCNEGYQFIKNVGDEIRTCVDGGIGNSAVFNGSEPICKPVVCDELPAINNGIILYQPDMSAQFDLGTVATYSCNEGYQLITNPGDEIRTCVDGGDGNGGVFNGAKPICESVCDELTATENGVIEYAPDSLGPEYDLNTVAIYICNEGFELNTDEGNKTRTCVEENGGVFDGQAPSCQPIVSNETICTVTEPLMVSPFTQGNRYTFMGTCEHILLESCPPQQSDFVVSADFITDSMDNGAIGVFMVSTETYLVSSEGGAFRDNAGDFVVTEGDLSGDHVRFYSVASVTVTLRPSESYNEITVGGGVGVTVSHDYGDTPAFTVSVSSGSSIGETCGLCGTQEGQLQFRNGDIADITDRVEVEAFTMSYLVPARDQALRPQRRECGIISNDSVILESLHTVRINTSLDDAPDILCYQVSGRANQAFNLVSDLCVNVNAYYSPMNRPVLGNIMSEIGVRAATDDNRCYNIRVARDQCQAFVQGPDSVEVLLGENMMIGGLSVRLYSDRVRISAPNCRQVTLVMWIICDTSGKQDFLHFVISRGINLRPTSHGLLGQFWNIPMIVEKYTGRLLCTNPEDFYTVTVTPRTFLAQVFRHTWDKQYIQCLYAGNSQGGASNCAVGTGINGTVIEGDYEDYQVGGVFSTDWKYAQFNEQEACSSL